MASNSFLDTLVDPRYILVNAPSCRTRRQAIDFWLTQNRMLETHPTMKERETILHEIFHPYSGGKIVDRQTIVQEDKQVRKSVRIGLSSLAHEKRMIDLLRSKTTIPVSKIFDNFTAGQYEHLIMAKMPGETLESVWGDLSTLQKTMIADQILHYMQKWRQIESPVISTAVILRKHVDHDMHSCLDFNQVRFAPFWNNEHIVQYIEQRCAAVEDQPFVFSHCDLDWSNILTENGSVTSVIDFECSGFFPAYWEWICTRRMTDQFPADSWTCLLERRLAEMKLKGWDGMWEVEQLFEALEVYAGWSLTPEDRQENRSKGWDKVQKILGCSSKPPLVDYSQAQTHPLWLEFIDGEMEQEARQAS